MKDLHTLEEKLGYTFRDTNLLQKALYHSSYANEHKKGGVESNERLEFLGDAVLGVVSAEFLFRRHPDLPEGELTRIRAALVREESLHQVALDLGLGDYLLLGRGEEQGGGRTRPSILADAVEAVFAAVYLDGGREAADDLIHRVLLDRESVQAVAERRRDSKTILQELVQRKPHEDLTYRLVSETGPDHLKQFTVAVLLGEKVIGLGSGHSKKEAEQSAAAVALENWKED